MPKIEKEPTLAGLTFDDIKDLTAAGLPYAQIKELAESGFSAEQIMDLAGTAPKSASGGGLSKEDLQEILKANQEGKYRQNIRTPGISAFSYPEGDVKRPKPTLSRETFVNGGRQREDQLTPLEIDAYNSVRRSCSARNGLWTAEIRQNGTKPQLHITLPTGSDTRPHEPIALICRELNDGPAAVDPLSLAARVAELEAKLGASA